ncbi:hypothetical protein CEUSTIGMA_g1327.t1 [Chlamydomonas eustigma]|uniref:Uncharacterized protein n=1 Tax=Chlamydomonas eustigma TaxID=1157962 RepID=A0A250WSR2_9CHLO|nr:hypothetical protein CEUSTIGMA_g1327.t1 [Chlamydomonas eustigma]|eukprot:GAX73877.1 hypothetical protein CEUSTIGMA_g1327.t1 [Chlamydomonas eustigma]
MSTEVLDGCSPLPSRATRALSGPALTSGNSKFCTLRDANIERNRPYIRSRGHHSQLTVDAGEYPWPDQQTKSACPEVTRQSQHAKSHATDSSETSLQPSFSFSPIAMSNPCNMFMQRLCRNLRDARQPDIHPHEHQQDRPGALSITQVEVGPHDTKLVTENETQRNYQGQGDEPHQEDTGNTLYADNHMQKEYPTSQAKGSGLASQHRFLVRNDCSNYGALSAPPSGRPHTPAALKASTSTCTSTSGYMRTVSLNGRPSTSGMMKIATFGEIPEAPTHPWDTPEMRRKLLSRAGKGVSIAAQNAAVIAAQAHQYAQQTESIQALSDIFSCRSCTSSMAAPSGSAGSVQLTTHASFNSASCKPWAASSPRPYASSAHAHERALSVWSENVPSHDDGKVLLGSSMQPAAQNTSEDPLLDVGDVNEAYSPSGGVGTQHHHHRMMKQRWRCVPPDVAAAVAAAAQRVQGRMADASKQGGAALLRPATSPAVNAVGMLRRLKCPGMSDGDELLLQCKDLWRQPVFCVEGVRRCDKEIARTMEDLDSTPFLGWESPQPDEGEELTLKRKVQAELKRREADAAARAAEAAVMAGASDVVVDTWRRSEAELRREICFLELGKDVKETEQEDQVGIRGSGDKFKNAFDITAVWPPNQHEERRPAGCKDPAKTSYSPGHFARGNTGSSFSSRSSRNNPSYQSNGLVRTRFGGFRRRQKVGSDFEGSEDSNEISEEDEEEETTSSSSEECSEEESGESEDDKHHNIIKSRKSHMPLPQRPAGRWHTRSSALSSFKRPDDSRASRGHEGIGALVAKEEGQGLQTTGSPHTALNPRKKPLDNSSFGRSDHETTMHPAGGKSIAISRS